ncbi:MAG: hypothetical protein IJW53_04065 [Clostridia bacterium]|nr:hypothetical protein [Clostridia bacterium]
MKLYFTTIGIAMAFISAVNIALEMASWYYILISVVWCTALQFVLDGAVALSIRMTPDRLYGIDNPLFHITEWEKEMYKRVQVRRWKDKVWELGGLGGFSKKNMTSTKDPEYVKTFIVECNRGVATHRLSYPVGFVAMLTLKGACVYTVALPVALVNLYLNILPTLVLRYNTPKLKTLYERLLKKHRTVSVS